MESNVQNPGEPAQAGGEPAQPTLQPQQTSGQPAQIDSYWQGQYDRLTSSKEYQEQKKLYDLFSSYRQEDGSNPLANHTMEFFNKNNPAAPPSFDPTIDFNAEDLSNPNTPTGQFFNSRVQEVAGSIVDQKLQKLEQAQQRQAYEQHLITQKRYTPDQAKAYVDKLMNPDPGFVQEFLMGKAADAFVAVPQGAVAPPAGPGLGPISATQAALPATGSVQGAQPAPKSEADKMFERIDNASGGRLPLKQ